jgi:hypothetical protein
MPTLKYKLISAINQTFPTAGHADRWIKRHYRTKNLDVILDCLKEDQIKHFFDRLKFRRLKYQAIRQQHNAATAKIKTAIRLETSSAAIL